MIIRPMEPEDADSVAQIEKDSFQLERYSTVHGSKAA